jgi:hypothetical protein
MSGSVRCKQAGISASTMTMNCAARLFEALVFPFDVYVSSMTNVTVYVPGVLAEKQRCF